MADPDILCSLSVRARRNNPHPVADPERLLAMLTSLTCGVNTGLGHPALDGDFVSTKMAA
ncbi:hypothetical protein LF1_56880 [Rubripirellula obstinata]|uniref:Uncharacterized protein n=1 Tax=Rubripirellula obstinata TaxID=406547 RepID=A0A5B1CBU7_9BACT|nr:hypothetical protein LF1_56880 [Rubripirellula obstinata]